MPKEQNFTPQKQIIVEEEISKLLIKGVITEASHCKKEYLSTTIFIRPRKDGSHGLILNLKQLNSNVEYYCFKMNTSQSAIRLMKPNCYVVLIC